MKTNKETREARIKFLFEDATKYVETLEKELIPANARDAYHSLVTLYKAETTEDEYKAMNALIKRYDSAVEKVNEKFPC